MISPYPSGARQSLLSTVRGIGGVLLHVEGLDLLGIVVDEHRPVIILREQRFVVSTEVFTPFHVGAQRVEPGDGIGVGDPPEGRHHLLERDSVALELRQLRLALLERPCHDVTHERFLQAHVVVRIVEGHLGLDHPELRQVASRLRLFRPKGRAEAVDLAQRRRRRLDIELAGLGQVRLAQVEVFRREEISRLLADRAGQDGRIDEGEALPVEIVADRLDHLVPDPGNGHLAPVPEPQVSMLEEERRPMLFRGDRIVGAGAEEREPVTLSSYPPATEARPGRCRSPRHSSPA